MAVGWPDGLTDLIPGYLAEQRWYAGSATPDPSSVTVERTEELWSDEDGVRRLLHAIVGVGDERYQLLLGERPTGERADFLHGREESVVGVVGDAYYYDATLDSEMAKALLTVASQGKEEATLSRQMSVEQSNTSLVFDDRIVLKVFRRLREGRNPDVEVTTALWGAGFEQVAEPLVIWRDETYDLGFGQRFLAGGSEGWALVLTSLRDFYSLGPADPGGAGPGDAGGDFAAEAERLGRVTAEMHLALAGSFGVSGGSASEEGWRELVDGLEGRLSEASKAAGKDLVEGAAPLLQHLRTVKEQGPVFRVHGDYHLGQVMRTDEGWYVLDFEGEPAKPLEQRTAPASPIKDLTSMLRSFHYASRHALVERPAREWPQTEPLALAWESHNRQAFLDGYQGHKDIHAVLPDASAAPGVMLAYELDKALYELDYEQAHRPEWVSIPLDALNRIIYGTSDGVR